MNVWTAKAKRKREKKKKNYGDGRANEQATTAVVSRLPLIPSHKKSLVSYIVSIYAVYSRSAFNASRYSFVISRQQSQPVAFSCSCFFNKVRSANRARSRVYTHTRNQIVSYIQALYTRTLKETGAPAFRSHFIVAILDPKCCQCVSDFCCCCCFWLRLK